MRRIGLLQTVGRLCLTVWLGGGLFLAFVLAPTAFHVLSDRHAAGLLVGSCLKTLHWIGLSCAAILIAVLGVIRFKRPHWGDFPLQLGLVVLMAALTAYSQFSILPHMESLRGTGFGVSDSFASLHRWSVWCESGVLLLGIALLFRMEQTLPKRGDHP